MTDSKSAEHDTTPETPQSKQTIAVHTCRSDPPPGMSAPRPAAGTTPPADPAAESRAARTLPRSVKAQPAPARSSNAFAVGATVFLLVMSVVLLLTMRGQVP